MACDFNVSASAGFAEFLADHHCSIILSAYRSDKLIALTLNSDNQVSVQERNFPSCMGLSVCSHPSGRSDIYVSSGQSIWRLIDYADSCSAPMYAPSASWVVGDIKCHDIAIDRRGRIVFVNTMFSCLSTLSEFGSFHPVWKPPFVMGLGYEDRCHLNGLAMRDGETAYVTALAASNEAKGWRCGSRNRGVLLDVQNTEMCLGGLCMPHSPRWHLESLWFLNSGFGDLCCADLGRGGFDVVCTFPGFPRGLAFVGDYACVLTSNYRDERLFHGLPLERKLHSCSREPVAGLFVVDLARGNVAHQVTFSEPVREFYDVAVLPYPRLSLHGFDFAQRNFFKIA